MQSKKPADGDPKYFFRLFNNLKDDSEVELARRELQALFGEVEEVRNFVDVFVAKEIPESKLEDPNLEEPLWLQDAVTYELPYGRVQGFRGKGSIALLPKLTRRLAYTREIYVVLSGRKIPLPENLVSGLNLFAYATGDTRVLRTITNQYFLEKSQYISRLSRDRKEIDNNLQTLLGYLSTQSHRIPATETMAVGRRLEDWFAIREEPSLYLTHYMHPYKGKFHPKMARALINYTCPADTGTILDNFSGSGTTLVEAQSLGLDSIGVDINPLSALMSQVKVQCIGVGSKELGRAIERFLDRMRQELSSWSVAGAGQQTLSEVTLDPEKYSEAIEKLPSRVTRAIPKSQIERILLAKETLNDQYGELNGSKAHEFLLLGVSGAISDVSRRTKQDFLDVLTGRLWNLWGRVYLYEKLCRELGSPTGMGACHVGDTRELSNLETIGGKRKEIADESIDSIVNSPPYSTALDYIRNDLPQLSILSMTDDMGKLERDLVGNPNLKVYSEDLQVAIEHDLTPFSVMPKVGQDMLKRMQQAGRGQDAARVLKFWSDMRQTFSEMYRVLKPGGRAAVVIGNNNIQLEKDSRKFEQVPNVDVLEELGKLAGLEVVETIRREIEKSMTGMIRNESIIIYAK